MWSLSLPLETRALPNGDEVAVRSTAVVVRLRLTEEEEERGGGGGGGRGKEDGAASRGGAGSAIER